MGKVPLAAAIDLNGVTVVSGAITHNNTAGNFHADYADRAIRCPADGAIRLGPFTSSGTFFSTCFYLKHTDEDPGTDKPIVILYDQAGLAFLELRHKTTGVLAFVLSDDNFSTENEIVSATKSPSLQKYVINVNITTGAIELHVADNPFMSALANDLSFMTGVIQMDLLGGVTDTYFSSIICDNEGTISRTTIPIPITGDGAVTDLTGDFNTITDDDNGTFLEGYNAGDVSTFIHEAAVIPAGATIDSLVMTSKGFKTGTVINDLVYIVRIGGVNYASSIVPGFDISSSVLFQGWAQNPVTVADWTQVSVNSAEIGFRGEA